MEGGPAGTLHSAGDGAMSGATQRFINYAEGANEENMKIRIFNTSIYIHLIISIIVIIILEICFFLFFNGILNIAEDRIIAAKIVYQFTVASTILTILTTPYNAIINAHENMKYYSIVGMILTLIKLLIAITIIYVSCDKLILYGFLMMSITLINYIIVGTYCYNKYPECRLNIKKYYDKNVVKNMFNFASYTFLTTASSMFSVYGGNIVINNFFGTTINAAQGVASQISGQLMVFSNNMLMAVNPVIGKKAGAKDFSSMIKYALSSSKFSYFILLLFASPFIIETHWIMKFWLKNIPEWAIVFCRLEILRKLLDQLLVGLRNSIISEGSIGRYSLIQSILYVLPLPITWTLFHFQFSPIWLYIIWILFLNLLASYNILRQAILHCHLNIKDFYNNLILRTFTPTIIIFITGLIPYYIFQESFIRIMLTLIFTTISFLISVWYIGFSKEEKKIVLNIFESIKNKIKK